METSIIKLADFAGKAVSTVNSQEQLFQQHKRIFKVFLLFFSFRAKHGAHYPHFNLDRFEDHVFSALMGLVLKLNENLFKPLFIRCLEWAQSTASESGVLLEMEKLVRSADPARMLTFFKFVQRVSDSLKGIFVPYFGYLLDIYIAYMSHPVVIGASSKTSEHKNKKQRALSSSSQLAKHSHMILVALLNGLERCFLYDNQGFLTIDRFNKILIPIISLLESRCSDEDYEDLSVALVSCVCQLAQALGKDTLWKSLNYQILLKTRSRSSRVKLTVLAILKQLYAVLGEEFLVHLPESAPFLSELMEDSDPNVEISVQELIHQIDGLLGDGQSISDYF